MTKHNELPKVVEKSQEELDGIIQAIKESNLPAEVKDFVVKSINLALWLPRALESKKISLHRLRQLLFGKGYRKNKGNKSNNKKDTDSSDTKTDDASMDEPIDNETLPSSEEDAPKAGDDKTQAVLSDVLDDDNEDNKKKKGHGRMSHTVYEQYTQVNLTINGLDVGDLCLMECGGRLYRSEPGIIVRIRGRSIADVYKYSVDKLRCALCGYLVVADTPAEVGDEKYDAYFKSWVTLQKYYVAVPFYRQEHFQKLIHFPLPDATQWDLVEQVANCCYPVFNQLTMLAAQGKRIHNDDTRVRILEVIKEIKDNPDTERTGMNTTGIISDYEDHQIALFINGTQHAGENLEALLEKRSLDASPIIQMCDALNANIPKRIQTIVCNCLSHGFRKFEELVTFFPDECITIMKLLSAVFVIDDKTKKMNDEQRLAYHQQHSKPIMEYLYEYMTSLIDEHLVEPNSELGKAIAYMKRHWKKLTRFLTVAGAPIDNNVVERALKIAIRNRKAAMFYRTRYSAHIGGMLTSLIYTCHLANENAHHYLTKLQENKRRVLAKPHEWLPWNYQQTLSIMEQNTMTNDANHQRGSPPVDCLAAA